MSENSVISGVIKGYAHTRVILRSPGLSDQTETDENGVFRFEALPAGEYRLSVPEAGLVYPRVKLDGDNSIEVHLGDDGQAQTQEPSLQAHAREEAAPVASWEVTTEDVGPSPGFGIIRVIVEGKIDLPVQISAKGWPGFARMTGSKTEYGPYALEFSPLGAGIYTIAPAGLGVSTDVDVDGRRVLMVKFTSVGDQPPPPEPEQPGRSTIGGRVSNGAGLTVVLSGPEGEQSAVIERDGRYLFERLPAGIYALFIPDTDVAQSDITLDGSNHRTIDFSLPEVQNPARSAISGLVSNGAGYSIVLSGPDGERQVSIGPDETYRFEQLPAGVYSLRVLGTDARRSGLEMDGFNQRRANFKLVSAALSDSAIFGTAPGGAGLDVLLQGPGGLDVLQTLDESEQFGFTDLPAGSYLLTVFSPLQAITETVELDGANQVEVLLELPHTPNPERGYVIEDGGPGPGYGVIRVQVPGAAGRAVRVWMHGWQGMVRQLGDKPELGDTACEFAPLGGGEYFIQPEGMSVQAQAQIDGTRVIWVIFDADAGTEPDEPEPAVVEKTIEHYLLVGALPADVATLIAVLQYVARFQPDVGSAVSEALQAKHVTILGSPLTISRRDETRLIDNGAEVDRIHPERAAAVFRQRLTEDSPF